jgi:hypothetical protein
MMTSEVPMLTADDVFFVIVGGMGIIGGMSIVRGLVNSSQKPVLKDTAPLGVYLGGLLAFVVMVLTLWMSWLGFREPLAFHDGRRYSNHGWAQGTLGIGVASLALPFALLPLVYRYARARHGVDSFDKTRKRRKR